MAIMHVCELQLRLAVISRMRRGGANDRQCLLKYNWISLSWTDAIRKLFEILLESYDPVSEQRCLFRANLTTAEAVTTNLQKEIALTRSFMTTFWNVTRNSAGSHS